MSKKPFKIVCIGDVHIKTDNIQEINLFQEKVINYIKEVNPTFVVILGDVLHTHEHLHTLPLNKAYDFIQSVKELCFTYVLVGNHDMINNSQFLSDNHWMNGMKEWDNVKIVDNVVYNAEYNFILCPYVPNGRFIEALNTNHNLSSFKNVNVIFAHQEFKGVKMGAIVSEHGDEWDEEYPLVISGHIHKSQWLGDNIYYTGSSLQNAFGESDKNVISVYEIINNVPVDDYKSFITETDFNLPRKHIIYTTVEDIDDIKINEQDNVKISISGDVESFKAFKKTKKYKDLTDKGTKVVFKPKRIEKKELVQDMKDNVMNEKNNDFKLILYNLVKKEKNKDLMDFYNLVVEN